jgi:hypothetical protein
MAMDAENTHLLHEFSNEGPASGGRSGKIAHVLDKGPAHLRCCMSKGPVSGSEAGY